MSQEFRQSNLFAAENFTNIYKSFKNVDYRAYDYDGLKAAMIEYIKRYYPEDFNDYVESSEYVALIELLAFLGTALAFRVDINSRENIMDTATRRESIIRLARMVNYMPSRNVASTGLFKITALETNEPLYDSLGKSISNIPIFWNDPNNIDAYDQFLTIFNAVALNTNPFGKPYKKSSLGGMKTDLYRLNTLKNFQVAYPVSIPTKSGTLPFDIVNTDIEDGERFIERHPDPSDAFHMIYRNDGHGNGSKDTGFFLQFRQGTLSFIDYKYTTPIENRIEYIDRANINRDDVYVQNINSDGAVLQKWTEIPPLSGNQNIFFNTVEKDIRTVYSVTTEVNDSISLRYADGNFGDIPTGIMRTWFRTSANKRFTLSPEEAQNITIVMPYVGADNNNYNLYLTFSLKESVNNSSPSETNEEIKLRAPQVFYTQNRMVNNEDYNVFPLTRGNEIIKLQTVNRTHAGHSRYIDINDPTGFHENLIVVSDDGALFKNDEIPFISVDMGTDIEYEETISGVILHEFLGNQHLVNFFYDDYLTEFKRIMTDETNYVKYGKTYNLYNVYEFMGDYTWLTSLNTTRNNTGYFKSSDGNIFNYDNMTDTELNFGMFKLFSEGSKIKFKPNRSSPDFAWATVLSISSGTGNVDADGQLMTLDINVKNGWQIEEIIPAYRIVLNENEITSIKNELFRRNTFGLKYDVILDKWSTFTLPAVDDVFQLDVIKNSWLVNAEYFFNTNEYVFKSRGTKYVFESFSDVKFFFNVDNQNNRSNTDLTAKVDTIEILSNNTVSGLRETWLFNPTTKIWTNSQNTSLTYPETFIVLADRSVNEYNSTILIDGKSINDWQSITVIDGAILLPTNLFKTETIIDITYDFSTNHINIPAFWELKRPIYEIDGYLNAAKVEVGPADTDRDGIPDEPLLFSRLVSDRDIVFSEIYSDEYENETNRLWLSKWLDIRYVVDDNTVIPYPNMVFDDIVNEDLTLVALKDYTGLKNSINFLIADEILSELDPTELTNNLNSVDGKSIFVERLIGRTVITYDTYDFSPMVSIDLNYSKVDELIKIREEGRYLNTTIYPPEYIYVDWANQDDREFHILQMGSLGLLPESAEFIKDTTHEVHHGRSFTLDKNSDVIETFDYKWEHYSPDDHRIDPSISNIMDMIILTHGYHGEVVKWKNSRKSLTYFPTPPSVESLRIQFGDLAEFKMMSDQIIFNSAKFKVLFGENARPELRAKFKIVRIPNSSMTDNELKSDTIKYINEFFNIDNWDFGETFFFTELAAYIHTKLQGHIGSIILVPTFKESIFGNLFQVKCETNELFITTATVNDVEVVNNLTETNMRA